MKILKNEKGQSLVEFAIILPYYCYVMGILEFGYDAKFISYHYNAAREGARQLLWVALM